MCQLRCIQACVELETIVDAIGDQGPFVVNDLVSEDVVQTHSLPTLQVQQPFINDVNGGGHSKTTILVRLDFSTQPKSA